MSKELNISISECLSLWESKESIELPYEKTSNKKLKIGYDFSGKILRVVFKYLESNEIEILSASRV